VVAYSPWTGREEMAVSDGAHNARIRVMIADDHEPVRKYCSDRCRMAAFAARQRTPGIAGSRARGRMRETPLPAELVNAAAGRDVDAT
jgi:hypothetical protein